eukprot:6481211-Prymnesium_polylepis.1
MRKGATPGRAGEEGPIQTVGQDARNVGRAGCLVACTAWNLWRPPILSCCSSTAASAEASTDAPAP